ncbi:hypothetical protein M422DRAFT_74312 [Sphaerobolus stellatus SS14]|nr:hypothetical protein M422DRAFT_74312 [Sphaerobolus stellatus SS14]
MSPPPIPSHILRGHGAQVNSLAFSPDNERLYSGDASGHVIITLTRSLRPLASWQAHADGILGIEEWNDEFFITHGRDNKLHMWLRIIQPTSVAETAATPSLPTPVLRFSMDVNALNYCRFSLLSQLEGGSKSSNALLAVPNLVESSLADIWRIPSIDRVHAAIGKGGMESIGSSDGRGETNSGIIMSLHLYRAENSQLRILQAFENGSVSLFVYTGTSEKSIEGRGWDVVWNVKPHVESIMGMAVKTDNSAAFTVSADNLICRYDLQDGAPERWTVHRTKHPGNGVVCVRDDGRVFTVGGWDGKIRLYSSRTFKSLGTLSYHKDGCYAAAFARYKDNAASAFDGGEEEEAIGSTSRLFVSSGKDTRIALWELKDFEKNKS